ncbi:MAG: hypothetical protein JST06_05485 [Bacteroidetes bacterium]|nr:hypothetical protein [Bacteroidota bacterium]
MKKMFLPAYVAKISDLVNGQMTAAYFSMPHSIVAASVPCCGDRQITWQELSPGNIVININ